jgi:NAD(P)-dependent dehydrogenase (short-subunit alcohol dehydrogenase family)
MTENIARTAVVTGAAGNLGSAIVRRLVKDGRTVVATDLSQERLNLLVSELGEMVIPVTADISTRAGSDTVAAAAPDCTILVNNAGIPDRGATLDEIDDDAWEQVIQTNLTGALFLSRRLVPRMIELGGGVIINMSSVAGLRGGRTGIAYTASKWALIGMAENIAATLGRDGIRGHAVCPGPIERPGGAPLAFTRTARAEASIGRDRDAPPRGTAQDVAEAVSFLSSDAASYLNGVVMPIDGGAVAF